MCIRDRIISFHLGFIGRIFVTFVLFALFVNRGFNYYRYNRIRNGKKTYGHYELHWDISIYFVTENRKQYYSRSKPQEQMCIRDRYSRNSRQRGKIHNRSDASDILLSGYVRKKSAVVRLSLIHI